MLNPREAAQIKDFNKKLRAAVGSLHRSLATLDTHQSPAQQRYLKDFETSVTADMKRLFNSLGIPADQVVDAQFSAGDPADERRQIAAEGLADWGVR